MSQKIYYSLEARDAEYELVPLAMDQDCSILVWSPLAGGLLSGKFRRDQDASEGRHVSGWDEPPVRDPEKLYDTVDILVETAVSHGVSAAPVSPRSGSGHARKNSSRTTWRPPNCNSPKRSAGAWTR